MKKNLLYLLLLSYALIAVFTIFYFDGTGDAGDSVLHFLYSKYAIQHPELYFNHWAKPFFVLLSSPFAQFGMRGMKFFNVLVILLTLVFTFKSVEELKLKNAYLSLLIIVFSPLTFILTFSGLTEPLFALMVSAGLFGYIKKEYIAPSLLLSFLPFVRSEGLIIIAIFGFFLMLKKQWKYLPLLLFGHLFYSIVGYWTYEDLFWVFNKIPYNKMSSTYGKGELFHFVEQLLYVVGVPIYLLFWLGVIELTREALSKRINLEIHILVFLGFITFFSAHTLFWYLGIFNSMGLKRVLIGIMPFISIISVVGFNFLTERLLKNNKKLKNFFQVSIVAYILLFPFTPNPSAVNWNENMSLSIEQKKATEVSRFMNQLSLNQEKLYYAHPYLSLALKIDHFDSSRRMNLTMNYKEEIHKGDLIVWDYWFSVVEEAVSKEELDNNPNLQQIYTSKDKKTLFSVYRVISITN